MIQKLTAYQRALPHVRPWVALAVALVIVLLAYYGLLGARYWTATSQIALTTQQINQITRVLREALPGASPAADGLEVQRQRINELGSVFRYRSRDDLVGIVAAIAEETSVSLTSLGLGERQTLEEEGILYQLQPMVIVVGGRMGDLDRFLARLSDTVSAVTVSNISIGGLESVPTANIELLFHLSPQISDEESVGS